LAGSRKKSGAQHPGSSSGFECGVHGALTLKLRKLLPRVLVIETEREFLEWLWDWHTTALIPVNLAKKYLPSFFNRKPGDA
jgi:hypothetical protein